MSESWPNCGLSQRPVGKTHPLAAVHYLFDWQCYSYSTVTQEHLKRFLLSISINENSCLFLWNVSRIRHGQEQGGALSKSPETQLSLTHLVLGEIRSQQGQSEPGSEGVSVQQAEAGPCHLGSGFIMLGVAVVTAALQELHQHLMGQGKKLQEKKEKEREPCQWSGFIQYMILYTIVCACE